MKTTKTRKRHGRVVSPSIATRKSNGGDRKDRVRPGFERVLVTQQRLFELSAVDLKVLDLLRKRESATIVEIIDALPPELRRPRQKVKTAIGGLHKKGLLRRSTTASNQYVYHAEGLQNKSLSANVTQGSAHPENGAHRLNTQELLHANEPFQLSRIVQIREEVLRACQAMQNVFCLSEVIGARLSGSVSLRCAGEWAMQQLTIFGLSNVHKEPFPFGAGWLCNRFSLQLVQPFPSPLFGFPLAWSSGTSGPVVGDVTLLEIPDISSDRAMEAFKLAHCGNLKGKILIHEPVFDIRLRPHPFESTISDEDLIRNLDSRTIDAFATVASPDVHRNAWRRAMRRKALCEFAAEEGALAVILQGRNLRLGSVKCAVGYPDSVNLPPQLAMTGEHYNRIRRLTDLNIPVSIELDMQVRFTEDSENAFNVVAELPGANGNQEFVMLGAHLDSWHTATGATDNAAGCAVAIEAFRVLRKLNVPLQRTVRLVLWSGHEQGGAGSKAYVNQHFGDWQTKAVGKEHSQLYAYFNVDSGGGKIRALSIQGNQMMKPIVERWLVALRQVGVVAVDLGSYRGMDMRWFEQLGLPVIQFWQEGTDLHNMIRETNMDVYDRLRPRNLAQASAAVASVIYMAANEPEPLPRKPLPWQV